MYPIRVERLLETPYLLYFILSTPFVRLMVDESMRVAMPKVNRETLKACHVVVPDHAERLMGDIAETLNAMFTDLLQSGELEQFLRDRGCGSSGPIPLRKRDVWFDVPFSAEASDRDPALALR
jgi:hypothetical protein